MTTPYSVAPGEGSTIEGPAGGPLTFKARGEQTDGNLTLLENTIAPLDGPPLHIHANEDEAFYILEGHLRFLLEGKLHDAPTGTFIFIPRGTRHCFQNIGDQPARIIVLFTPSGMEQFFDRFAAQDEGAKAFRSIGAPLGMDVVGPPLRD